MFIICFLFVFYLFFICLLLVYLGVFMMLVATQGLSWEFFAETLTILLVQFIMGIFAFKSTHTMFDATLILSLYPLSLACVYILEAYGWD